MLSCPHCHTPYCHPPTNCIHCCPPPPLAQITSFRQERTVTPLMDCRGRVIELTPGPMNSFITIKRPDGREAEMRVDEDAVQFLLGRS